MSTPSELLKIGDNVTISVNPEQRGWTTYYKDIPDGTKGVVCGFSESILYEPRVPVLVRQPGTYYIQGSPSVWLHDGRVVSGSGGVCLVDRDEEKRRDTALRGSNGIFRGEYIRLGDLPETKFWEQDKVRVNLSAPHTRFQIVCSETFDRTFDMTVGSINYNQMHTFRDGLPFPFYTVNLQQGAYRYAAEADIELIERGNVWKYYHGLPLMFADIKEEATFFHMIGQAEEVRNPKDNLYCWSKEEAIQAIQQGIGHGMSVSGRFFSQGVTIRLYRFKDEALGRRIADATLAGFMPST